MKQQKFGTLPKPVKSLSARNFFKTSNTQPQQGRKYNTIHTEPNQPSPKNRQPSHPKGQSKSNRQISLRVKQVSYFPPEQLYSQNMQLKGRVNKLTEQLMLQRMKHKQDTRHLIKMKKEVEIQFDDDKYLDVSRTQGKLIEGVKHQYQRMKLRYQDKCKEYNDLLKRYEISGGEQFRFQCEALEMDNKKLRDKFQILLNTEQSILNQYHNQKMKDLEEGEQMLMSKRERQEEQKKVLDLLGYSTRFIILQKKVQNLQLKCKRQQMKMVNLKGLIDEKNKKITFLDKLITEKANQNHHAVMRQRKTAKQLKQTTSSLQQLKFQVKNMKDNHEQSIQMIKQKQNIKFQTERAIFIKSLSQKDQLIQKLDSELKYISTIISYIKNGEDPLKQPQYHFNPLSKKNSQKQHSQQLLFNIQNSLSSLDALNSPTVRQRVKTLFESGFKDSTIVKAHVNSQALKTINIKDGQSQLGRSQDGSSSEDNNQGQEGMIQSRMVKRSYLKHNPDSVRMKHIKVSQIEPFREQLIYRFIFYRLTIDSAKEYLSYSTILEDSSRMSRKQKRWKNHYITMKQTRNKLLSYPFELSQQNSLIFARYIVEDATKDSLFYHQDNEVQRSIAKSILRAFVGEYTLPNEQTVRQEIKQVLNRSGKNLNSALTSLAPTGTISSLKLIQICKGIQIDFSEQAQNFILSQLAARSPGGLTSLNYSLLFQGL